jgi:hypothetical protein
MNASVCVTIASISIRSVSSVQPPMRMLRSSSGCRLRAPISTRTTRSISSPRAVSMMLRSMAGRRMMRFASADMGAAVASRLAARKSQLKITPAQEGAWKAYEAAVTQQAQAMQSAHESRARALTELNAVLTPEQQALAGGGWGPRGFGRR